MHKAIKMFIVVSILGLLVFPPLSYAKKYRDFQPAQSVPGACDSNMQPGLGCTGNVVGGQVASSSGQDCAAYCGGFPQASCSQWYGGSLCNCSDGVVTSNPQPGQFASSCVAADVQPAPVAVVQTPMIVPPLDMKCNVFMHEGLGCSGDQVGKPKAIGSAQDCASYCSRFHEATCAQWSGTNACNCSNGTVISKPQAYMFASSCTVSQAPIDLPPGCNVNMQQGMGCTGQSTGQVMKVSAKNCAAYCSSLPGVACAQWYGGFFCNCAYGPITTNPQGGQYASSCVTAR